MPRGHSLMDPTVPIAGRPSVKVVIQYGAIRGNIHLDPVYGSFHNLFDVDIPEGVVVEMFCRPAESPCGPNPRSAISVSPRCSPFTCQTGAF